MLHLTVEEQVVFKSELIKRHVLLVLWDTKVSQSMLEQATARHMTTDEALRLS